MDARYRDHLVEELRKQAGPAGWTPWQLARRIHKTAATPTLLMAWRLAAGLTQAELARSVRQLAIDAGSPCGPSTPSCQQISRWENGRDRPGAFYQALLAAWYRTDLARLGLIGDLSMLAEDDCSADPARAPAGLTAGDSTTATARLCYQLDQTRRRMDINLRHVLPAAEIDQWVQTVDQHVAAYGLQAADTLLERLTPDLADLADLVGQYLEQRDLTRLASLLSGLTGALLTDLGDIRSARKWLHTARRYAGLSGDLTVQHWAAMALTMTATYPPDPAMVLTLAGKTTTELSLCSCPAAAQLNGLIGRAAAALGDSSAARTRLTAAERIFDSLTAGQADERFFGFPHREMMMYTSLVLTAVNDPAAWNAQTDALSCYPISDPMDRPLILLDRARYLACHSEPDEAADVAITAITSLGPSHRIPLLINEARAVAKTISAVSPRVGSHYLQMLREAVSA